ncbi:MAG: calcium/sodium antiporter [Candidatus Thorarchaeota archaeon]|jgi:cation:H+ antiporter
MQLELIFANLGLFLFGLALLIYGSNVFVESASKLARTLGVSELFIGLTIVAIGTSLPEIVASSAAVIAGKPQLAFTNVIGSTIINMTLIVGVSALISPLASNAVVIDRDAKVMILVIASLVVFMLDPLTPGIIAVWEAGFLLMLFIAYLSFLITRPEDCESCYQFHVFVDYLIRLNFLTSLRGLFPRTGDSDKSKNQVLSLEEQEQKEGQQTKSFKDPFLVFLSALFIVLGAQLVVVGSDFITLTWGIQEGVIGLLVVALGTSLPELTVSVNSARRGFGRLLIGNVIGSNIINITLGLGIISLVIPTAILLVLSNIVLMTFAIAVALIFFYVIRRDWRVTRTEGILLLVLFIIVQVITIYLEQFAV